MWASGGLKARDWTLIACQISVPILLLTDLLYSLATEINFRGRENIRHPIDSQPVRE